MFEDLPRDVELRLYAGPPGEAGDVMRQLTQEMAEVSPRLRPVDVVETPAVEPGRSPVAAVEGPILTVAAVGEDEARVRFLGVTAGHEFGALIAAIRHSAFATTDLSGPALNKLAGMRHRVHVQVFTTPT